MTVTAFAPGRVNLIGEHTDYTGGLVLPMALDLGITVAGERTDSHMHLRSATEPEAVTFGLPFDGKPELVAPSWGRFVAGAVRQLAKSAQNERGVGIGFSGVISSDLPSGGTGLSSSSALCVALLLAIGYEGDQLALATNARAAEVAATGVEIGMMDQLASVMGAEDRALLIDCHDFAVTPIELPASIEVLVIHTGQSRALADSAYRERLSSCAEIEALIGPLRLAAIDDLSGLHDPELRRRARHVVTENDRVRAMVDAFAADDPVVAGQILAAGHASLANDYEVSTPIVDAMVDRISNVDGVFGARLTGGGFGGSLVAFCQPGTSLPAEIQDHHWWTRARPSRGATVAT